METKEKKTTEYRLLWDINERAQPYSAITNTYQPMQSSKIFYSKIKTKPKQKKGNLLIMPPQKEVCLVRRLKNRCHMKRI